MGEKTVPGGLDWKQTGIYSQPAEGQKVNSGLYTKFHKRSSADLVKKRRGYESTRKV